MSTNRALKRISTRFTNIEASVGKFGEGTGLKEVQANIQLLEDKWKDYRELEILIADLVNHADLQNAIEALYFKVKQVLVRAKKEREDEAYKRSHNTAIDELMTNQQSFLQEVSLMNKIDSEVRLPRINVPTFSGQYYEFPSFKDLFEASIDSNPKISKVIKFQYLKGLLAGEAAALVCHISVTEANYKEAWDKIRERFDKKRLVVANLIKQFVDQPAIIKVSTKALHQKADVSDEVIRGLKVLVGEAERRDSWLIHILVNKLDNVTTQAWANDTADEDFPTMERFFRFLNRRSDSLDAIDVNRVAPPILSNRTKSFHSESAAPVCLKCSQEHYLSKCEQFLLLSVSERRSFISERKLCFNCLSPSHQSVVCRSKYRCGKCQRRHHLTLHTEDATVPNTNVATSSNALDVLETTTDILLHAATIPSFQSLLPTAMVQVTDRSGNLQKCRVLLDSGSQASFITEACMQRLGLPRTKANITITGLGSGQVATRGAASITVKSLYSTNDGMQIDVLVIGQLPNRLPSFTFTFNDCSFLNDLKLADPQYNQVAPIDILIGADRFFHIFLDGRHTNSSNSVLAQRTIFGWIIAGSTNQDCVERSEAVQLNNCTLNLSLEIDIENTLKRFFEQEEIPSEHILRPEEIECEEHYKSTYKRNEDGRYMVEIPFKKVAAQLGNSEIAAKRRFLALERKLQRNTLLKDGYCKFINEYINLGYLQPITDAERQLEEFNSCYLPHHCVLKESSETTKLRVVFDGSAKSASGMSLNEAMLVGPVIQRTLWSILMRFRNRKIALTGDIEKMYNQVLVADKDAQFQRILWRNEVADEIQHYRLNTVTFGLSSSSFLAIRTLHQVAYDNQHDHPNIAQHILDDFYVDDFVSGADTVEEAQQLKKEIDQVLRTGGFKLRKWKSNSSKVMTTENADEISMFQNSLETRILGLQWNVVDDVFHLG